MKLKVIYNQNLKFNSVWDFNTLQIRVLTLICKLIKLKKYLLFTYRNLPFSIKKILILFITVYICMLIKIYLE